MMLIPDTSNKSDQTIQEGKTLNENEADEKRRRREKRWEARIRPILPGLSLGNVRASYNTEMLLNNHITAIVSLSDAYWGRWCVDTKKAGIPAERHKFVRCLDSSTQDLLLHMNDICDFIDEMASPPLVSSDCLPLEQGPNVPDNNPSVLVHCDLGISRSPTIIIAYLMRKYKVKLDEALQYVKAKQNVRPNPNFIRQLQIWHKVGYNVWEDGENTIAKPPYQVFLNDREILLKQIVPIRIEDL